MGRPDDGEFEDMPVHSSDSRFNPLRGLGGDTLTDFDATGLIFCDPRQEDLRSSSVRTYACGAFTNSVKDLDSGSVQAGGLLSSFLNFDSMPAVFFNGGVVCGWGSGGYRLVTLGALMGRPDDGDD